MASRMERYYKDDSVIPERSTKNRSLYEQIENLDNYTNIEGVATIEKTNEIDISKVQEMIKNRENYKKQKQLRTILHEEKEELEKEPEEIPEPKNYDIKDLLSKVDDGDDAPRRLSKEQYDLLKQLKKTPKKLDIEKEEEELKEIINTIHSTRVLTELSDEGTGLLDDLKSDTVVGDASSIKDIIEEEKKERKIDDTTTEIDKEFYTSSFGFTKSDFEELKNMNQNIKKGNKFIIVLLIVVMAIVAIGVGIFLMSK